jgi:flagellar biosynthesis protein FlhG
MEVISVSSGKGGVGKTLSTLFLGFALRKKGFSVLILDGDLGLSNVEILLNVKHKWHLDHVLSGHIDLKGAIAKPFDHLHVLSSGSGVASMQHMSFVKKQMLLEEMAKLSEVYDMVLIDNAAGINENVLHFNKLAQKKIVVTTPEPHALTDAYALIKVLKESDMDHTHLVVNMTHSVQEADLVFQRISQVAHQYLGARIYPLVYVNHDPLTSTMVLKRGIHPSQETIASQVWHAAADKLLTSHATRVAGAGGW